MKTSKKIAPKNITKDHLVEYRNLIIWMLNRKANYRGYMNLAESMNEILDQVNSGKVTYKTTRGIKGVLCKLALSVGLSNSEKNLREKNGISIMAGTYDSPVIKDFQQFRINALMGN